jgi:hypothetical protein
MNPLDGTDWVYIPNPLHQEDHKDFPFVLIGLQSITLTQAESESNVGLGIYTQPNYLTNPALNPHKLSNNKR